MDIYFYCEKSDCINSRKPVLLGGCDEYIKAVKDGAIALGGISQGDFSDSAICLGNFDGVHLGHKALFDAAKKYEKWGVLLFDRNTKGSTILTTQPEKLKILSDLGADYAVIAEFSEEFSHKSPEEFVEFLKEILKVDAVVAGYDYRFGYKAAGDKKDLVRLSEEKGIIAKIVESVKIDGEAVKSTKIREFIKCGDVLCANKMLGYNYTVSGIVETGFKNGTKMGFPTANIAYPLEKLLPADGVYKGKVLGYDAVVNIGKNPTFEAEKRTVEAHLIGYEGDLYGREIEVEFISRIRDDKKFKNIEALIAQIEKDIKSIKERK